LGFHVRYWGAPSAEIARFQVRRLHRTMERRWRAEGSRRTRICWGRALLARRGLRAQQLCGGAANSGTAGTSTAAGTAGTAALRGRGEFGDSGDEHGGGDCGRCSFGGDCGREDGGEDCGGEESRARVIAGTAEQRRCTRLH
jgi:hypothetical protein